MCDSRSIKSVDTVIHCPSVGGVPSLCSAHTFYTDISHLQHYSYMKIIKKMKL